MANTLVRLKFSFLNEHNATKECDIAPVIRGEVKTYRVEYLKLYNLKHDVNAIVDIGFGCSERYYNMTSMHIEPGVDIIQTSYFTQPFIEARALTLPLTLELYPINYHVNELYPFRGYIEIGLQPYAVDE